MKEEEEIFKRLENITYFDLDEFLALDIYDLEKALKSKNPKLKEKAKKLIFQFKCQLNFDDKTLQPILDYLRENTPQVYNYLKDI